MPLWDRIRQLVAGPQTRAADPFALLYDDGPSLASGVWVSEERALRNSTVYACVRLLASTLAALPLHAFRRSGPNKRRVDDTALARVLARPNDFQTAYKWRETMWQWVLLYGNAPNKITWKGGEPVALTPLEPWLVDYQPAAGGGLTYRYSNARSGGIVSYGAGEILHVKGLTSDGRIGYGVIDSLMRDAVGLALTLQATATTFYANNARPGGIVKFKNPLSDEAKLRFKRAWEDQHRGANKAGGIALLEEDVEYTPFPVTAEQAQFLESRQYSTLDICRAFGVPPHLIGDSSKTSYASAEQNALEFVTYTLLPWCKNFEAEIVGSLVMPEQRATLLAEHNLAGLMRGDLKSRNEAYAVGVQNGWLSRNEVRSLENLNPEPGLDEFLAPLNMTTAPALAATAEQTINPPEPPALPAPEPTPPAPTPTPRAWTPAELRALAPECAKWPDPDPHAGAHPETHENRQQELQDDLDDDAPAGELTDAQDAARRDRQGLFADLAPLWRDAAARLTKREVANLRDKLAAIGDAPDFVRQLDEWLAVYYRELGPKIPAYFDPVVRAAVRAAVRSVQRETGDKAPRDGLAEFVDAYLANLAAAWAASSEGQLRALLDEHGADAADPIATRLDEWEAKRPEKTALQHAVDGLNASIVACYALVGVAALIWAARGKSCPYCRGMHGRRVATGAPFLHDGLVTDPQTGGTLRVYGTKRHPGLHQGCDCTVVSA